MRSPCGSGPENTISHGEQVYQSVSFPLRRITSLLSIRMSPTRLDLRKVQPELRSLASDGLKQAD